MLEKMIEELHKEEEEALGKNTANESRFQLKVHVKYSSKQKRSHCMSEPACHLIRFYFAEVCQGNNNVNSTNKWF